MTNDACMGRHDWVSKKVKDTDEVRWVERDTMDKTGTHHSPSLTTHFARRAVIPGNLSVQECASLHGTDCVVSGVLYGAAVVQQWSAQQCVCVVTVRVAIVGNTCALNGASNRAWLSVGALNRPVARHTVSCRRNKARQCEMLTEEDTI